MLPVITDQLQRGALFGVTATCRTLKSNRHRRFERFYSYADVLLEGIRPIGLYFALILRSRRVSQSFYYFPLAVSRFGPAVRRLAGKQKDLGSILLRLSSLLIKAVVCGRCLVTLSLTVNETLKWLLSLPILMQVILVVTV